MTAVIFDLDGTLADTGADLIYAANACFRRLGLGDVLDVAQDQKTAMMGGGRAMLKAGFSRLGRYPDEDEIESYYPLLLDTYEENIDKHTRLYPGVVAGVEALKAAGYPVGICTNKPDHLAELLLSRLGVRDLFDALIGANTLTVRKPDPAPLKEAVHRLGGIVEKSVLVGDSPTDRDTARAAGAFSLLVTFGPDGRGVEDLAPEGLLESYDDLTLAVGRLLA